MGKARISHTATKYECAKWCESDVQEPAVPSAGLPWIGGAKGQCHYIAARNTRNQQAVDYS